MGPTHQDLSNDTTFSQIKSRVPVPLMSNKRHKTLSKKRPKKVKMYKTGEVHLQGMITQYKKDSM